WPARRARGDVRATSVTWVERGADPARYAAREGDTREHDPACRVSHESIHRDGAGTGPASSSPRDAAHWNYDLHAGTAPSRRERMEREEPVHRLGGRAAVGEGGGRGRARRPPAH